MCCVENDLRQIKPGQIGKKTVTIISILPFLLLSAAAHKLPTQIHCQAFFPINFYSSRVSAE